MTKPIEVSEDGKWGIVRPCELFSGKEDWRQIEIMMREQAVACHEKGLHMRVELVLSDLNNDGKRIVSDENSLDNVNAHHVGRSYAIIAWADEVVLHDCSRVKYLKKRSFYDEVPTASAD